MDELKMILETVSGLGGNAMWGFIAYLASEVLKVFLITGMFLILGVMGFRAFKFHQNLKESRENCHRYIRMISSAYHNSEWLNGTDIAMICNILRKKTPKEWEEFV